MTYDQFDTRVYTICGGPCHLSLVTIRVSAPPHEDHYHHREGLDLLLDRAHGAEFFAITDTTANNPILNPAYPAPDIWYNPVMGLKILSQWVHRLRALGHLAASIGTPYNTDVDLNMMTETGFAQVIRTTNTTVERHTLSVEYRTPKREPGEWPVWVLFHKFAATVTDRRDSREVKADFEALLSVEVDQPLVRYLEKVRRAVMTKAERLGVGES